MGSYATLLKQTIAIALFATAVIFAAPTDAKPWCALISIGTVAFFVGISVWRHRQITRLSVQIDEVLHSGRTVQFTKCREGDVAVLTNELEKMIARLARMTDQLAAERNSLADALADISHQIRTPLTAAELMLPAIERMDDPLERKRALRSLEEMLERVAWLVTTLLKIAKVDAGSIRTQALPVAADAVIKRASNPLEAAFDLRDVQLLISVQPGAAFTGDEMWTAEALENILKNCLEHTPAGGSVSIAATENALATMFTITDTGPGIAEEDLPHIFERFYRGIPKNNEDVASCPRSNDERKTTSPLSSSPTTPDGFGIGLALAQALVSVQGGTVRASNAPQGGAQFQIAFPKLVV